MTSLSQKYCNIIDLLAQSTENKKKEAITALLLEFEAIAFEPEASVCLKGLPNKKETVKQVYRNLNEKDYYNAFGDMIEERLNSYQACEEGSNYKKRRQLLENIIRILQPVINKNDVTDNKTNIRLLTLLARTYLYRGLLFRTRGFTTPARKIEALKKAMQLTELALKLDENFVNSLKIWSYASLELTFLKDYDFQIPGKNLKKAGEIIIKDGINELADMAVMLEYATQFKNNSFLEIIILNEKREWERPYDLLLFKARA